MAFGALLSLFDSKCNAVLLVGGNKSGGSEKRFYRQLISCPLKRDLTLLTARNRTFIRSNWCRRGDSNPHELPHTPLKRARLPVPPLRLIRVGCQKTRKPLGLLAATSS